MPNKTSDVIDVSELYISTETLSFLKHYIIIIIIIIVVVVVETTTTIKAVTMASTTELLWFVQSRAIKINRY
jgi:hypothetical protein